MPLEHYAYNFPARVYGGKDAIRNIRDIVREARAKRVMVLTDRGVYGAGLTERPCALLNEAGVDFEVFREVPTEPEVGDVAAVVAAFRRSGSDFLIAVGGGSVMDTAKLISILATDDYTIHDLLIDPMIGKKQVKTLMIPTTAGTGAEATPNAIVKIPEKQVKFGIVNHHTIADYVILDAAMTEKLPRPIAAATGVDALAHAIECYTGRKANPFSDMVALEALRLIFANIEEACNNPQNEAARNNMLIASFYAGIAIATAGTTAVHALSYPLGGKYGIPHGVSNAMLLAPVMRFNEDACRPLLSRIYSVMAADPALSDEQARSGHVVDRLQAIVENLDIPKDLKGMGVPPADLESLVESGFQVKRLLDNNLKPLSKDDIRELYRQLF